MTWQQKFSINLNYDDKIFSEMDPELQWNTIMSISGPVNSLSPSDAYMRQ